MKKVVLGNDLKELMSESVNLICDTVASTLGPSGNNVLINNDLNPFITNDGVTIAESISSEDKVVNSILEIIKEAALKTDELVGDGTTTTLVLLKSIFNEGLSLIKNGKNAISLRNELEESLTIILDLLNENKKSPSKKDLIKIAQTSCENYELGEFLTKVFLEVNSKHAIKLDESKSEKTYVKYKKGYGFELDNVSSMYFINKSELELKNVNILLYNGYLDDLETISEVIKIDENLIILVADASNQVKEEIISYNIDYHKNIFLFNLPDYYQKKYAILNDLAFLSDAKIKDNNASFEDLGKIDNVVINKDEIVFSINKDIDKYVNKLKNELDNLNDFDNYFMKERISRLETGIAIIYVGGITKTEIKEKRMRIEDAINALEVASLGVSIGSGIEFLKISDKLEPRSDALKILKIALKEPFKTIYENCGEDYLRWENIIKEKDYKKVYDLKTKKLEDIEKTRILDSIEVLKSTIKNAISIASILLTTNYLVINETLQNTSDNYL